MIRPPHRRGRVVIGAGIAELGAAGRPRPQRPDLAVAAHPRIACHYDGGNELYRLMLYETKSEAGFRTRSLRDAQLVFA